MYWVRFWYEVQKCFWLQKSKSHLSFSHGKLYVESSWINRRKGLYIFVKHGRRNIAKMLSETYQDFSLFKTLFVVYLHHVYIPVSIESWWYINQNYCFNSIIGRTSRVFANGQGDQSSNPRWSHTNFELQNTEKKNSQI